VFHCSCLDISPNLTGEISRAIHHLHHAVLPRRRDCLRSRGDIQSGQHIPDVGLHRTRFDGQSLGDSLNALISDRQTQHLSLSIGWAFPTLLHFFLPSASEPWLLLTVGYAGGRSALDRCHKPCRLARAVGGRPREPEWRSLPQLLKLFGCGVWTMSLEGSVQQSRRLRTGQSNLRRLTSLVLILPHRAMLRICQWSYLLARINEPNNTPSLETRSTSSGLAVRLAGRLARHFSRHV
jgi:hypothetical protein